MPPPTSGGEIASEVRRRLRSPLAGTEADGAPTLPGLERSGAGRRAPSSPASCLTTSGSATRSGAESRDLQIRISPALVNTEKSRPSFLSRNSSTNISCLRGVRDSAMKSPEPLSLVLFRNKKSLSEPGAADVNSTRILPVLSRIIALTCLLSKLWFRCRCITE